MKVIKYNERLMEVIQNYCAYCFLDLNSGGGGGGK